MPTIKSSFTHLLKEKEKLEIRERKPEKQLTYDHKKNFSSKHQRCQ